MTLQFRIALKVTFLEGSQGHLGLLKVRFRAPTHTIIMWELIFHHGKPLGPILDPQKLMESWNSNFNG